MKSTDYIALHVSGIKGTEALTKENLSLKELGDIINDVGRLFESNDNSSTASLVAIEDGCAKLVFQSTKQVVKQVVALFPLITGAPFLQDVDAKTAIVIESIQQEAKKKGYTYLFEASSGERLSISPTTRYERLEPRWVEGEFYFYGEITNAGGASDVNVHIKTRELGILTIDTSRDFILSRNENIVFRRFGIRMKVSTVAVGEFCVENKLDEFPLKFVQILPYNFFHAVTAGQFAKILLDARKSGGISGSPRVLIQNDVKQLTRAQYEDDIKYFVTSDTASWSKFSSKIAERIALKYKHLDIRKVNFQNFDGTFDFR